ncbi:OmpH family outer membrane protein [Sphingomonas donggukensis]|uniref:OmpH family outer membrane protein n=1 Tax=Sphingomonas donggukensis TaxID=2949093 RepID=A0ABY4TX93_9SPHN|nr:OmpH family outer membrane protein [Sphingomonas donggukensis]URW76599.1 OmpH family outer membrane protein [Sphingomonas donggukensis]
MKTYLLSAVAVLATVAPAAAQQVPDAKIAVVDTERLFGECTACKAANTQLQTQRQQLQTSAQSLGTPLQTEGQAIQTALNAAKGTPDAALQTRITAFETRQRSAQQQLATQQQTFERNVAYVRQQIGQKIGPIITQVAQSRGATLAVDKNNTFFNAPAAEITDAVLAQLNAQLPSVSTVAPAAPAATTPAAPATTTPATPRRGR